MGMGMWDRRLGRTTHADSDTRGAEMNGGFVMLQCITMAYKTRCLHVYRPMQVLSVLCVK